MASRAGSCCDNCVAHRGRFPCRRPMTAIADDRGILTTFVICRNAGGRLPVTTRTGSRSHTSVIKDSQFPSSGSMTTVTGPRSHPPLVTGRNTRREHAVTACTRSRFHCAVIIPAAHQSPRSSALLMARIARCPGTVHMARRLSLCNRPVMTPQTGPRKNPVVRKECRRPICRTVATVTVNACR